MLISLCSVRIVSIVKKDFSIISNVGSQCEKLHNYFFDSFFFVF